MYNFKPTFLQTFKDKVDNLWYQSLSLKTVNCIQMLLTAFKFFYIRNLLECVFGNITILKRTMGKQQLSPLGQGHILFISCIDLASKFYDCISIDNFCWYQVYITTSTNITVWLGFNPRRCISAKNIIIILSIK